VNLGKIDTGKNGTDGKVEKNGTLMLNFSKLKPQTPNNYSQTPNPYPEP